MAKNKKGRKTVYRDKKTGRFASKATWKRSRGRGGKRYVAERLTRTKRLPRKVKKSRRGKTTLPRTLPKKHEYQVNVKYAKNIKNAVEVQISAIGPPNQNRERVIEAIDHYINEETDGENLPGWKVRLVFWEKYGKQSIHDDQDSREHLRNFFYEADLEVQNKTTRKIL